MKAALAITLAVILLFVPVWSLQAFSMFVLSVLAVAWAYSRATRAALAAWRLEPVLRGHRLEPMEVRLSFANRGPLPLHFFLARDADAGLASNGHPLLLQGLGPWQRIDYAYRIEAQHRGEYEMGPLVVRGGDPLGLFPWERRLAGVQRVIVYPRILAAATAADRGLPSGAIRTTDRSYEDVTRYRSLREYLPGDEPRRIAWKASARLASLHTIEYATTLSFSALILLDLSIEDYPERGRYALMERAIEAAASLAVRFSAQQQGVGLASSGLVDGHPVYVPPKAGSGQVVALLETLARVAAAPGRADFAAVVYGANARLPAGGRLCAVAPPPSAEQEAFLARTRAGGCDVELYLVGAVERRGLGGIRCYRVREYGEPLLEPI